MAEFLTTADVSAAIQRVIREADSELILMSAFVYPRVIHLQQLAEAGENGVHIRFVFGKRSMDKAVFKDLLQVQNMDLYFLKELHAKTYMNETEAIVTSLNLLNSSEAHNREMGVRLGKQEDLLAYKGCRREAESILKVAEMRHSTRRAETVSEPTPYGSRALSSMKRRNNLKASQKRLDFWYEQADRLQIPVCGMRVSAKAIAAGTRNPSRHGESWLDDEYRLLERMIHHDIPLIEMCEVLQRTRGSLESKLFQMGYID